MTPEEKLLEARAPFDNALSAIREIRVINEQLVRFLLTIFENLNPDWEDNTKLFQILMEGKFPILSNGRGDLRIDGQINTPN